MQLSKIHSPEELKKLSLVELEVLSAQIRSFIIETLEKTGGHLSSNLGTVELTLALHRVFSAPEDRIVWDVGHQTYTHKIITGRKDQMNTIRQYQGLSGFLKCHESPYDCFGAGHATTSLSAMLGFLIADRAQKKDNYHVAVIGDGSLSGGMAFEAMNILGARGERAMIILNDNEMSIGHNVGVLAQRFNQIRNSPRYFAVKNKVGPQLNPSLQKGLASVKKNLRRLVMKSTLFEEMGLRYYGPVDGHNLEELIDAMEALKDYRGPTVLHVLTKKGKGYEFAEKNPNLYHGVGAFDSKYPIIESTKTDFSAVFGNKLLQLAKENEKIFAITAAMADGTGLKSFQEELPQQIVDVGIAEESAITMATAMALGGLKPYVAIYSTFLQRSFDQLIHDMALHGASVVLCIDRSGIVGADGETHQGIYDTSFLSIVPNMQLWAPMDAVELEAMLDESVDFTGPLAIKYPRGNCPRLKEDPGVITENRLYARNSDLLVVSYGSMMESLLELQKETSFDLYNHRIILPIDRAALEKLFKNYQRIIVVEENIYTGSLAQKLQALFGVESLTLMDGFLEQGTPEELRKSQGLDKASIKRKILKKD